MEAVPRMPMIWLDLKEAGEFSFNSAVKQFVLKNYGENPENYNEELKKLEQLRQNAVNVPRDFEGCSILRKYFGQLHYLQSRIPMGSEHEAAVPITWTEIFSGKSITHEDIKYEQACILYNLGALHSMLGATDKRVSEEGMKVSCTHFQCAAGALAYLRDHFAHSYSVDMSHPILNLNINLMLGQAQECLLEKSMLDNRKNFLVARISAQVVDYYKEACRALENSDTASLLGKIQKDWKKLVQMKIYYFAAIAHLHMGKQSEEQQKYGDTVAYFQSALDKLNEAIKQAKGQPATVQDALKFTMDVIGGKYNSAKKDNDFIYHESVPALDTLQPVKGAPLVKPLPVNPTDPAVTGPDIFSKLVPMAAHEASSLYSEEKAKLLRDLMSKIEAKNEILDQFTDSLQLDPETVDNLDLYNHIPPVLMEKCAALSVRPDTVKSLVQSMQVLSGVYTDVEGTLNDIKELLDEYEKEEQKLQEVLGTQPSQPQGSPPAPGIVEVRKDWAKYMEVHEKASFTNTELHKAMNLHISNLRLLSGPLEQLRAALPTPTLTEDDKAVLQTLKRILCKVQEMKTQRASLEQQLRDTIQKDDITTSLVTTDRSEMKKLFEEQLKKYDQLKVYIDQNLAAQENILKALTDANVKYAAVRKILTESELKWNSTAQSLVSSYEAYEDLIKKSQEGKDFYADLERKVAKLLEKARASCEAAETSRQQLLEKEMKKKPPPRPTAPKPALQKLPSDVDLDNVPTLDMTDLQQLNSLFLSDLPEELRSLPPEILAAHLARLSGDGLGVFSIETAGPYIGARPFAPAAFAGGRTASAPMLPTMPGQPAILFNPRDFNNTAHIPGLRPHYAPGRIHHPPAGIPVSSVQGPYPSVSYGGPPYSGGQPGMPMHRMQPSAPHAALSSQRTLPSPSGSQNYPAGLTRGHVPLNVPQAPVLPNFHSTHASQQGMQPPHMPSPMSSASSGIPPYNFASSNVTYRMSQQVSASGVLPGGPRAAGPFGQPSQFPGAKEYEVPQPLQGVRPSTTTVDSIQAPISSYTAPQDIGGQIKPVHNSQQPSGHQLHGSYAGPQGHAAVGPFPYNPGGVQHLVQPPQSHFPSGPGHPIYQQQIPMLPNIDMQVRPPPFSTQPPFISQQRPVPQGQQQPPIFQPQMQTPMRPVPPTQMHPQHFQPQVQGQFQGQHGVMAQVSSQPPGQVQLTPHLGPHGFQHPPPQDKLPQHGLPSHSGSVSFPGALPRVSQQQTPNIPATVMQTTQQLHPHPASTGIQSMPAVSSAPSVSSMPFCTGPPNRHPGPPGQMPPGSQMQVGLQPISSGTPIPRHVPASPSPVVGQMQGGVITSGPPSMPSPAPSPQPSMTSQTPAIIPPSVPGSASLPQRPPPSLTPGAAPLSQPSTEVLFHRQSSSTDDLLSSSPESQLGGSKTSVNQPLLQPTKADSKDSLKPKGIQLIEKDPYEQPEHIMRLLSELDRFRNVVNCLEQPTSASLTELDCMWKEFQDAQEKEARQLSIAIARCYAMKNRHQDIMPYDKNRIVLQSGKDDYINASKIEDLSSYCPTIIATQAPLVGTASDFWLMVHEQKISLIVMLVSEQELEKQKVPRYFPTERGQLMVQGPITLTLTSYKVSQTHVERMITLQYRDQTLKRTIIHLQFISWPELGLPDRKGNLLKFIQEVHGHYLHQRPLHTPILVHCSSGVGRTGAFCLMYAAMQEVEAGNGIPDLAQLVKRMRQQRKHMLQEKLHLKYCYEAVLMHAEQVLQRHGVATPSSSKPSNFATQKLYALQDPQDIVLGGDMPISSIQATIAKLSIKPPVGGMEPSNWQLSECAPVLEPENCPIPAALPSSIVQLELTEEVNILPNDQPPESPPVVTPPSEAPAVPTEIVNNHTPEIVEQTPSREPPQNSAPSSSSLDLLASLTPEAFNLDNAQKGKQKMNKQSFLQPQNGEGLSRGIKANDDPLSMLDPLWRLNKT